MFDPIHDLLHMVWSPVENFLALMGLGFPELVTILFIIGVLTAIPWVNIFMKAGYSPLKGYMMFIPVVNIFMFFKFAFGEWPIERELRSTSNSGRYHERA